MSDMKTHAVLSPSGADRWVTCPGSVALTKDLPDTPNAYSAEGTDYHELAALALEAGTDASEYVGHPMISGEIVTDENAEFIQQYLDTIRVYATHGTLLVEERVPLTHLTGELNASGTADAVILGTEGELIVVDLKFGRGVAVSPEKNRQLMMYASGVIAKHGLVQDYKTIRLVICQPRNGGTQEYVMTMAELLTFEQEVKTVAAVILNNGAVVTIPLPLVPSEKACRFCKASATCPALTGLIDTASLQGFEDLTVVSTGTTEPRHVLIGRAMDQVSMVESWCKSVRATTEVELLAGREVTGYKLVQGKKGNRQWTDATAVEAMMRAMRLKTDEMYALKLITPPVAEKLLAKVHKNQWSKILPMIEQRDGVPSVAPMSDGREALLISQPADGFEVIDDYSDLM